MTIKLFNGSNFNTIAQRIRVYRDGFGWTDAKKISAYREGGGSPFWSIIYPDLPVSTTTSIFITGTGIVGTSHGLDPNPTTIWASGQYRSPDTINLQWQRSLDNSTNWTNIVGANSSTYTPGIQDNNYYIRCQITAVNEKGTTSPINSFSRQIVDPTYTYSPGLEFGVNSNSAMIFDKFNNSFPDTSIPTLLPSRVLAYFYGDWTTYDLLYKSDSNTFRIYHRLYRSVVARPSLPSIEYEIVFYNNTNFADIYVINPVSTSLILQDGAYWRNATSYKSYNLNNYASGKKFRVTMDGTTAVSTTNETSSNSVPVISASLSGSNVATFTTSSSHNLFSGSPVTLFGLPSIYNGTYTVASIPNLTTFTVSKSSVQVTQAQRQGGVAILTTSSSHGINSGDSITVTGLNSPFNVLNGTYIVTSASGTTIQYSNSGTNISSGAASGNVSVNLQQNGWEAYAPSLFTGWIYLSGINDSSDGTLTFAAGDTSTSGPNFNTALNKSDMFWPNSIASITTSGALTSSVNASWTISSGDASLNPKGYRVTATASGQSTPVFDQRTSSTNITINNLILGTNYNIVVEPNSRSDVRGQFSFSTSTSYTHAAAPTAPTNVTGTAGNTQVALTWSAPASNGGAAITNYLVRYSSNGGASWSTSINTGGTATSYTVTGLSNGTSYIFQVAAVNSRGQSDWSTSSPSLTPQVVPTNILATTSSSTVLTFNTATITAQLRDSSNNNVSRSGITINFSLSGPAGSTISATSAVTNSSGQASVTFTAGANSGAATITASSSGLTSGVASLTVNLRSALTPSLTWSAQNYGVSVSHNNYDFNYTYSGSIGFPGSLRTGSFASTAFTVLIPVQDGAEQPGISGSNTNFTSGGVNYAGSVTCTISNVWVQNPIINITVSNTRSGYSPGSTTLSNVQGNRARNSITYELINTANGNVMYSITTTATTVTHNYPGSDVGKTVRWRCTPNYNDGYSTNTIRFSQTRTLG